MKRSGRTRAITIIVATLMAAAACTGSGESTETGSDDVTTNTLGSELASGTVPPGEGNQAEDSSAGGSAADSSDGSSDENSDENSADPSDVPDQWIEQVPLDDPSDGGWPVSSGRWATSSLSPAFAFDVPDGLSLVDHADASIRFGLDRPGSSGHLRLVVPSSFTFGVDADSNVANSIDGMTQLIEEQDATTLVSSGRFDRADGAEVGWWELDLDDELSLFSCSSSINCATFAITTGQAFVFVPTDQPFVMVTLHGDTQLAAFVTGPSNELDELVAAAETMLTSAAQLDTAAEAPDLDLQLVTTLPWGPADMAPGSYQQLIGGGHVQIDLAETVDEVSLSFTSPEMLILALTGTDLAIIDYTEMLVDPAFSQAGLDRSQASAIPRLATVPTNIDEWSTYADTLGALTATGATTIGGVSVPWFEFAVEPGSGRECGPGFVNLPADAECIEFMSGWFHSDQEGGNRHHVYGAEGVLVIIYLAPGVTIDDATALWQPILNGLTISPS